MNAQELRLALRRIPADRFVKQALAMLDDGQIPDADLLRRCGLRIEGSVAL